MTSGSFNSNNIDTQKKKPPQFFKLLAAFLIIVVIIIPIAYYTSCSMVTGSSSYLIEYRITGTAHAASVTYTNEGGGTSQIDSVALPWSYTITAHSNDVPVILAQNQGDSGTVTVSIYKDGTLWKTSTSSGAYVVADASGLLP
jgi:hypothetical protein